MITFAVILFIAIAFLIIGSIAVIVWYTKHDKPQPAPAPAPPHGHFIIPIFALIPPNHPGPLLPQPYVGHYPPYVFYSWWSTASRTNGATNPGWGRDNRGQFRGDPIQDDPPEYEMGYTGVDDLNKFKLTYAYGHAKNPMSDTWQNFLDNNVLYSIPNIVEPNRVLVIEAPRDGTQQQQIPIKLTSDITVRGIVVRHGGILVIGGPNEITINTNFILVESGGLLQIGTEQNPIKTKVNINLTHYTDYYHSGVITSQYAAEIYAPGVKQYDGNLANLKTSYTGMQPLMNTFGTKTIGVGFNGNIQLHGDTGLPNTYAGTWSASTSINNFNDGTPTNGQWIGTEDLLTINPTYFKPSYPNMWVPLTNTLFNNGETTLTVDPDFPIDNSVWTAGSEIVITGIMDSYTTLTEVSGEIPMWINGAPEPSSTTKGLEMAKISAINGNTITLDHGLRFIHDSRDTTITRDSTSIGTNYQGSISVKTRLHVALLTRYINITSDLNDGGVATDLYHFRTHHEPEFHAVDMLAGLMNQDPAIMMAEMMGSMLPPIHGGNVQALGEYDYLGPGGSIVGNFTAVDPNATFQEVYNLCYLPLIDTSTVYPPTTKFIGNNVPDYNNMHGTTMFENPSMTGPNSIYGGQCMFRYGSSVNFNGVRLKFMSTPANFGTVGQYALHFHLAGYPKSFNGYLSDSEQTRDAIIQNCSIDRSFSRWVTIHGTCEVKVVNNVGFVSYGSGFFCEDGTETHNVFEHNIGIATLPCSQNDNYNPLPIYPNVGSDVAMASTFWFKSSQNACLRNVACCSPSPVIGIWYVTQQIGRLRGPSSVCVGDEVLGLPGFASIDCVNKTNNSGLNQYDLYPNGFPPESMFVPAQMKNSTSEKTLNVNLAFDVTGSWANVFTSSNTVVPYQVNAENIAYQIFGGVSEFPEALAFGPNDIDGEGGFFGCPVSKHPSFLPLNGQNSCTDNSAVAQAVYFETTYGAEDILVDKTNFSGGKFAYQPIPSAEINQYNSLNNNAEPKGYTWSQTTKGHIVPKIISSMLTYSIGVTVGTLWGGAGWVKEAPAILINCCFLVPSSARQNGEWTQVAVSNGTHKPPYSSFMSSVFTTGCGSDGMSYQFDSIYPVFWNYMTNGGIALPSNPLVIGGKKMLMGENTIQIGNGVEYSKFRGAVNNFFFYEISGDNNTIESYFPASFFSKIVTNDNFYRDEDTGALIVNIDGRDFFHDRSLSLTPNLGNLIEYTGQTLPDPYPQSVPMYYTVALIPEDQAADIIFYQGGYLPPSGPQTRQRNGTFFKYQIDRPSNGSTINKLTVDLAKYFDNTKTTKYPYFYSKIDGGFKSLPNTTSKCTMLYDAINSQTSHFTTDTAKNLGDTIADALSRIPPGLPGMGFECGDDYKPA